MTLSRPARLTATFIALTAWATLMLQIAITTGDQGGVSPAIWHLARYFTLLTNFLVALSFLAMAWRGGALSQNWLAGLTLWILIVGIVYHLLLAAQDDPQGLRWWTNQGFHTAAPVLVALFWLAFAPKQALAWRHAALWLIWPLAYVIYALVRAGFDGNYPYFFIDAGRFGYGQVALNSLGLCAAFYAGGLGIVGIGKAFPR